MAASPVEPRSGPCVPPFAAAYEAVATRHRTAAQDAVAQDRTEDALQQLRAALRASAAAAALCRGMHIAPDRAFPLPTSDALEQWATEYAQEGRELRAAADRAWERDRKAYSQSLHDQAAQAEAAATALRAWAAHLRHP